MRAISIALAVILSGCAMRPGVNLSIDEPTPNTIQGWGYPSADGKAENDWYYSLGINLKAAYPFVVVLPDGYRANSKLIDSSLLIQHFAPIGRDDKGNLVSSIHHADKSKSYWMIFTLNEDGIADHLSLYACKHRMQGLLSSVNGKYVFNFPIKESEIVNLFGGPVHKGKDFTILGWSCD